MITNFNEIPNTIEGIKFFIFSGEKTIKELRNKANRLEQLISEAKNKLAIKENSLKNKESII